MAAAPPPPKPSRRGIASETTRVDVAPWPPSGKQSVLVLRLVVTETHSWFGIGGRTGRLRRPRRLSRDIQLPLASSSPDYLRSASGDDCRRLVVRATMHELHEEEGFHGLSPADWDKAVPAGVEARVAELVAERGRGSCTCEVRVDVRIRVGLLYCEADALQEACVRAGRRENGGGGDSAAPPQCAICFEEMSPDDAEATCLPGCAHGFHGSCIGMWFEEASTCPVCRRDKIQFLPPAYAAVRDMMLSDPESSC